jgi:hypothetical protein
MQEQLTVPIANRKHHSIYEISRETAVKWRRNWEADLAASPTANFVRSYRIDAAELQEILAIPGMKYVSVYFGRADRGDHDRMILVAADSNGRDMVQGEGAKFFDFTTPRPPFGDTENTIWW